MATRQEIQAALDLIRFTNCAQDIFNVAVKGANGELTKTVGDITTAHQEAMTTEDKKAYLTRSMQNIDNYNVMIRAYLSDSEKRALVTNGLTALGVSLTAIENDITTFEGKSSAIKSAVTSAKDDTDIESIGSSISADIPDLNLVRNK
jgi:hypothetical protein